MTTQRKKIATQHAPGAIGPYSQAIAAGGLLHCSGQIALDPVKGELVGRDAALSTLDAPDFLASRVFDGGIGGKSAP